MNKQNDQDKAQSYCVRKNVFIIFCLSCFALMTPNFTEVSKNQNRQNLNNTGKDSLKEAKTQTNKKLKQ